MTGIPPDAERLNLQLSGATVEYPMDEALKEAAMGWPLETRVVLFHNPALVPGTVTTIRIPDEAPERWHVLELACGQCKRKIREVPAQTSVGDAEGFWWATGALVIGHMISHHKYNMDGSRAQ